MAHIYNGTCFLSSISELQNFIYDDSYIGLPQPRIAAGARQQAGALCLIYEFVTRRLNIKTRAQTSKSTQLHQARIGPDTEGLATIVLKQGTRSYASVSM